MNDNSSAWWGHGMAEEVVGEAAYPFVRRDGGIKGARTQEIKSDLNLFENVVPEIRGKAWISRRQSGDEVILGVSNATFCLVPSMCTGEKILQ